MLVSCKLQRATPIHFVKIHSVRGKKHGIVLAITGWQVNLLSGAIKMADLIFIVITVVFFAIALAYVRGCDRL